MRSIARGIALFQRRLLGLDAFAFHPSNVRLVVGCKKRVDESLYLLVQWLISKFVADAEKKKSQTSTPYMLRRSHHDARSRTGFSAFHTRLVRRNEDTMLKFPMYDC